MDPNNIILDAIARIDASPLTFRDVRVLAAIRDNPGQSGKDLTAILRLKHRSGVENNLRSLIKCGFIIDKREVQQQAVPCRCYVTEPGTRFLEGVGL